MGHKLAQDKKYLSTCKNIFAIWGSKNASIFTKILLEMNHMYKSNQLKNYDNLLKTKALASIYISDFIFIYFILKTVKKSSGKLAVSAKIIGVS